MIIKKAISRRQMLGRLGGAGAISALSPFVPLLESANAQTSIKRYAYWHEFVMPEASIVDNNYQANAGALQFKNDYSPLNAMKDKIIFLRKMTRKQGEIRGQGPHPFGAQGITGWRGDDKQEYNVKGISLDQFLAQRVGDDTAFSDIRAGFRNSGNQGEIDTSSSVIRGVPQPRYQSPIELYNDVFKNFDGAASGGMQPSDLLRRRKSVLDYMRSDIDRLTQRISHFDQQRVNAHLQAIRDTEKKLESQLGGNSSAVACDIPQSPGSLPLDESKVYPAYSELVAQALACNLTRIAGMCFGSTTSNLKYAFLNEYSGKGSWHSATHGKDNGANYLHAVLKFRAQSVANFLKILDSIEEPDGNTLLDNTIFGWFTDVARNHNTTSDIHCVLAGGKGRFKGHGQMINVSNRDTYNQLLGSMASFVDETVNVNNPGYCDTNYGGTGVLSSALYS